MYYYYIMILPLCIVLHVPNSPEQWYSQMLIITKILNVSQNAAEGWLGVLISVVVPLNIFTRDNNLYYIQYLM